MNYTFDCPLKLKLEQEQVLTPYDNFLYLLKPKETKRQYPHKLGKFFGQYRLKGNY